MTTSTAMGSTITPWADHAANREAQEKRSVTVIELNQVISHLFEELDNLNLRIKDLEDAVTTLENPDHSRDPRDVSVMPVDQEERYTGHGEDGRPLGKGMLIKNRCQG